MVKKKVVVCKMFAVKIHPLAKQTVNHSVEPGISFQKH